MTGSKLILALVAGTGALAHGVRAQEPVFRAVVDAVNVSVSVRDENRPVTGLKATDFELLDNGVPQEITSTSVESLPVDVTLVLDTSASLRGAALDKLKSDVQRMADLLGADDRVRLVAFSTTVNDVFGLRPGGTRLPLERISAGGWTSFYNALAAALMMVPDAERPQLVFGFSDGFDTTSVLSARRLLDLAPYSSAAMYVDLVRPSAPRPPYATGVVTRRPSRVAAPNRTLLQEAAAHTGGLVYEDPSGLPSVFRKVLSDFRTSYALRYMPRGVKREGWHDIVVRVHGGKKYDIRARRGYQGG